jgi:hypothetical protein
MGWGEVKVTRGWMVTDWELLHGRTYWWDKTDGWTSRAAINGNHKFQPVKNLSTNFATRSCTFLQWLINNLHELLKIYREDPAEVR